jgi:methyl-accepting chemotaxis protein
MEDEYEVISTSPLRRLEKRLNKLEDSSSGSEISKLIEQIIELIKSNQRVIDDVIKSDSELRNEVSKIPGKIDALLSSMQEFIDMIKASATEEETGMSKEALDPLVRKMDQLIEQNKGSIDSTKAILTHMGTIDTRLKRLYPQQATEVR